MNSLAFEVVYDQALRVFLMRSRYNEKMELLSRAIKFMLDHGSVSIIYSYPPRNSDSDSATPDLRPREAQRIQTPSDPATASSSSCV